MSGASPSNTPVDVTPFGRRAEAFLQRHRRWIILAIVLLSVLIRVAYYVDTSDSAYRDSARFPNTDMRFFDDWGREIAGGDWLGADPLHPMHDWHQQIATIHFRKLGETELLDSEVRRRLWNDWYGGTRFHQEPLYPYAIGASYGLFGTDPRLVYLWQMVLGVLSNLLIYLIARRGFSDRVALVAAALAIGCGPLLFYETVLLRSASITFLGLLSAHVAQSALDRSSRGGYLLAGLCVGLATLLKSTLLLLGLGALVILVWRERGHPRVALVRAGVLAAGIAICLLPVAVRNAAVGAPVFSLSSVGAITYYSANFDGAEPDQGFQISLEQAARILDDTDGRMLPTMLATLRTHPHPGSWLALSARKLGAAWHGYEIPNNVNYYVGRANSRVLRLLPVHFSWIGALALAGMVTAVWRRRGTPMLYLLVLAQLLPLLVFYVLSRFRTPLLAALIPFAAAALVWWVEWLLDRRWRTAAAFGLVVLLTALWTTSPRRAQAGPQIRLSDLSMVVQNHYEPELLIAHQAGDTQKLAQLLDEMLRLEPPEIEEIVQGRRSAEAQYLRYLSMFAFMHSGAAQAHREAGHDAEAERLQDRSLALKRLAHEIDSNYFSRDPEINRN